MRLSLNGEDRELAEVKTLRDLLEHLAINPEGAGIALALNGQVIPRRDFPQTEIREGDKVEIVRAVQGG